MDVREWVRENLKAGISPESIRKELINKGYNPKILEDVQKELIAEKIRNFQNQMEEKIKETKKSKKYLKIILIFGVVITTLFLVGYYLNTQTIPKETKEFYLEYLNYLSEKIQKNKEIGSKFLVSEEEYLNIPNICYNESQLIKDYYNPEKEYEEGVPLQCGNNCTYYIIGNNINIKLLNYRKYRDAIFDKNNLSDLKICIAKRAKLISSQYYFVYMGLHIFDAFLDLINETKMNINSIGEVNNCEKVGEFFGNVINMMLATSQLAVGHNKVLESLSEASKELSYSLENYTYKNKTNEEILAEIKNRRDIIFNSKLEEICADIKVKYPKAKEKNYIFEDVKNLTEIGLDIPDSIIKLNFLRCEAIKKGKELNENFVEKIFNNLKDKCDKESISKIALLHGYIESKK
ncbi:MAG TPA: hypothetical protein EYP80_00135 [Candidatus Aenigmarchaeota archaeon]|nr:hypothetical protein [Candidatus Aenigmarchaeota archaeon]